ncbi:hypothetical protein ABVC38_00125 [Lactobacillus iners]|uniref:hypothetical protein n=1 Tax=Lactobacillus iners TaxID=147802 RepID=UPI00336AA231
MKLKKRYVSTVVGVALATVGALNVNTTADAATNVRPLSTTLSVRYNGKGNVRLLDRNGKYMNQYVANKASYKVFEVGEINGKTMYRIGSDKQWIPANYTNLKQVFTNATNSTKANVVTIKYVPGYGIAVWTSPSASQSVIKGKVLKHNSSWKFFAEANGNDGYVWYNLGGNQWISSRYTNKTKVANSSVNNGSSTGTNTPAKPATPSKPSTDTKPVTPSNPNTSSDSKPVEPTNPTQPAQGEPFDAAKVQALLWQKIQNLRTSTYRGQKVYANNIDQVKKNGFLPAYKTSSELQGLADLRLEESKQVYDHVRPNGDKMDVAEYEKLLPNLAHQNSNASGFTSAGECLGVFPGQGLTNEQSAQLLFDMWTVNDPEHKKVLMSSLDNNAYAAVAVKLVNGEMVAVFEEVNLA